MKITLETTQSEPKYSHSVQITTNGDDLNIYHVWDDLIVPALLGFGFGQSSIDELTSEK